jgi:hypothetical protein
VIAGLLGAPLLAWLAGWLVVSAAWPAPRPRSAAATLARAALQAGFGVGLSSAAFVLGLRVSRPSRTVAVVADLVLLAVVGSVWMCARRRRASAAPVAPMAPLEEARPPRTLTVGVLLLTAMALAMAGLQAIAQPHGDWDAWAIWNVKARFMVRGGEEWRAVLAPPFATHPDYPLLLPGAVARGWIYLKRETWLVPAVVAGGFTAATVLVLSAVLALRRGRFHGLLAAILLLGSPAFLDHGLDQTADVPVGFFLLAALAILALTDRWEPRARTGLLALAGLALGLAAWTKNEGALFLLCVTAAHGLVMSRGRGVRVAGREVAAIVAGATPGLAVLAQHRIGAPPGWLLQGQSAGALVSRALDPERYPVIGRALLEAGRDVGGWPVSVLALLLFCGLVWGVRVESDDRMSAGRTALALGAMLLGVVGVYGASPLPLRWQLDTSLLRVLTQLWPSVLLLFGLVIRPPWSPASTSRSPMPGSSAE